MGTSKWHAAKDKSSRHETQRSDEVEEEGASSGTGVGIFGTFFAGCAAFLLPQLLTPNRIGIWGGSGSSQETGGDG